jgi:hypothetical protein
MKAFPNMTRFIAGTLDGFFLNSLVPTFERSRHDQVRSPRLRASADVCGDYPASAGRSDQSDSSLLSILAKDDLGATAMRDPASDTFSKFACAELFQ